jgi:cyclase
MLKKPPPALRLGALLLLVVPTAVGQTGTRKPDQPPASPAGQDSTAVLHPELLKTGLYLFAGEGANSTLRLSPDGLLLVDGKTPASASALQKQIKRLADPPRRFLVLTSDDSDKTGFVAKAVASGLQIYVNENLKSRLSALTSALDQAAQIETFDREETLHLGAVDVQLLHLGSAHTSGDTVVYFPDKKTVALGALYASPPDPDFSRGGSMVGWGPVLAGVLKLDFNVAVPGNGRTITRAELEAYKAKIDTLTSSAAKSVGKGISKDQFNAQLNEQLKAAGVEWQFHFTADQLDRLYAELGKAK